MTKNEIFSFLFCHGSFFQKLITVFLLVFILFASTQQYVNKNSFSISICLEDDDKPYHDPFIRH